MSWQTSVTIATFGFKVSVIIWAPLNPISSWTEFVTYKQKGSVFLFSFKSLATSAIQNNLRERIIETAEKKKIPFQRHASSRYTGTDTDAFAYSNGGVASALISLPLRYMHTTVELVSREDVENVIKLLYETLLTIGPDDDFTYFK